QYDNSTLSFFQADDQYAQRVRLPARSLREKQANCLDGAVLFASMLLACEIPPFILLIRDHAIVGWKVGWPPMWLETSRISSASSFADACKEGVRIFDGVSELADRWVAEVAKGPDRQFPGSKEFAIIIDVAKEQMGRKIVPLTER